MCMLRAKGAFVSSRQRWIEEGEQNSTYFFRLERLHSKSNSIQQLKIDDTVCDDPKIIFAHRSHFYSKLYTSQCCEGSASSFLESVEVNHISDMNQEICDAPLTLPEITHAINGLKYNNSPGVDGLTSEFYRAFVNQLAPFLLKVLTESLDNELLPPTLPQGLITLIPKSKTDPLLIDNCRPISS